MRLKRLELRNWCQHRYFSYRFKPGIAGIFGPNGAGKTNLVESILACLTGDFGSVLKERKVCRWMETGEKSYAELTAEHNGVAFTIRRGLSPSNQEMKIGDKTIKSAASILVALEDLLEMPVRAITDTLFVRQNKVADILTRDYEDRAKAIGLLCGADRLQMLWKLLGDQQALDRALGGEIVDNSAYLLERKQELDKRLYDVQSKLKAVQQRLLLKAEGLQLREVVSTYEIALERQRDRSLAEEQLVRNRRQRRHVRQLQDKAQKRAARLQKAIDKHAESYETWRLQISQWASLERRTTRRRQLTTLLAAEKPEAPAKPANYQDPSVIGELLKELSDRYKHACDVLRAMDQDGVVECPTCGTPVANLEEHLKYLRMERRELPSKIEEAKKIQSSSRSYKEAYDEFKLDLADYSTRREAAQAELDQMEEEQVPEHSIEELQSLVEAHKQVLAKAKKADDRQTQLEAKYRSLSDIRHDLVKRIHKLDRHLKTKPVSEEQYKDAKSRLEKSREAKRERELLRTRESELSRDLADYDKELINLQDLKRRTEVGNLWLADLAAWREVVHRDNLQRVLSESYLEDLIESINEQLTSFDTPFTVSLGEKLSMLVHNTDGSTELAEEQSGGEKVVLSIAYRLAVNQSELLILDEPTAGLDVKNLDCLGSVLKKLSQLTKRQERQIIMVTHDERLERFFDHVIQLVKPSEG